MAWMPTFYPVDPNLTQGPKVTLTDLCATKIVLDSSLSSKARTTLPRCLVLLLLEKALLQQRDRSVAVLLNNYKEEVFSLRQACPSTCHSSHLLLARMSRLEATRKDINFFELVNCVLRGVFKNTRIVDLSGFFIDYSTLESLSRSVNSEGSCRTELTVDLRVGSSTEFNRLEKLLSDRSDIYLSVLLVECGNLSLARLPRNVRCRLRGLGANMVALTGNYLNQVEHLENLTMLDFSSSRLLIDSEEAARSFEALTDLKNKKRLNLSYNDVNLRHFFSLSGSRHLRYLSLKDCRLNVRDLCHMASCNLLEHLALSDNCLSSAVGSLVSTVPISALQRLCVLEVSGCELGEAEPAELTDWLLTCPTLVVLNLETNLWGLNKVYSIIDETKATGINHLIFDDTDVLEMSKTEIYNIEDPTNFQQLLKTVRLKFKENSRVISLRKVLID